MTLLAVAALLYYKQQILSLAGIIKSKKNLAAGLISKPKGISLLWCTICICQIEKGSAIYNAVPSALSFCLLRFNLWTEQKLECDTEAIELFMGYWDGSL